MSEVTSPILTDATGQEIVSKLDTLLTKMDNLAAAFQPNASGIVYSNTTSGLTGDDVQEAIDEVAGDVSQINASLTDLEKKVVKTANISKSVTVSGGSAITSTIDVPAATQALIGTILGYSIDGGQNAPHIITQVMGYNKTAFNIGCRNFWSTSLSTTVTIKIMYTEA